EARRQRPGGTTQRRSERREWTEEAEQGRKVSAQRLARRPIHSTALDTRPTRPRDHPTPPHAASHQGINMLLQTSRGKCGRSTRLPPAKRPEAPNNCRIVLAKHRDGDYS